MREYTIREAVEELREMHHLLNSLEEDYGVPQEVVDKMHRKLESVSLAFEEARARHTPLNEDPWAELADEDTWYDDARA